MTHSRPKQNNQQPAKPASEQKPAQGEAVGQEPKPFGVDSPEEAALVIAAREVAASFDLEPGTVALRTARVLYALTDAKRLGDELEGRRRISPKFRENYATQLEELARVWLESRAMKPKGKRGGKRAVPPEDGPPNKPNPDAGHGAADGFGGTDYPTPGPDEDRPQ